MSIETENAKLLHRRRKNMYAGIGEYHSKFIDPETGLIGPQYLQERSCPVCHGDEPRTIFTKGGGTYVQCEICAMVYLNPAFRDEELNKYYEGNNTLQAGAHEAETEFYTKIYSGGLDLLERFGSEGRLLDVGCSSGLFLDIARSRGFVTSGIELNDSERSIAESRGHPIWGCALESLPSNEKFDLLTLWDVFEHIKSGSKFLNEARGRIRENGILFLQVPNVSSFAARILWDRCNMFDGIEHVNLYSPRSLKRLAETCGFEVLSMSTVIDELTVAKNYMSYQDPYFGKFSDADELSVITPNLIHENLLGYKIQAVLKPKR